MIEVQRCSQKFNNAVFTLMQVKAETSVAVQAEIHQLRERYQVNFLHNLVSILHVKMGDESSC